jgi:DNA repair protein RecO (recombination protein O)
MAEHLALVLKSVRFQDPSKIVTFFSQTEGLKTGFARGATSRDNRFGAALEPLTLCRITGRHQGIGSLYRIHHSFIIDSFRSIHADFNLLVWSGLIVRFLLGFLPPDHPEPDLFACAVSSLSDLDLSKSHPDTVWCRFAIEALDLLGYRITLSGCGRCGQKVGGEKIAYRVSDGAVVCMHCFGREMPSNWIMTSGIVLEAVSGKGAEGSLLSSPGTGRSVQAFLDAVIREYLPRWIPTEDLAFLKSADET